MQKPRCYIIGSGGHGRVVLDIINQADRSLDVVGFLDSNPDRHGMMVDGVRVLSDMPAFRDYCKHLATGQALGFPGYDAVHAIVAIGDNETRFNMAEDLRRSGLSLINAIHPSARLPGNLTLGHNIVIAAGVLIGVGCKIDDSVILNTGCIVDHGSWIGEAAHICPGAKLAGGVSVEPGAFIGTGATIIPRIRVGRDAVVGAGAVVIEDVAANSTVVGVPARPVKINSDAS